MKITPLTKRIITLLDAYGFEMDRYVLPTKLPTKQ